MVFDFSKVTVIELDTTLSSGRFSSGVREMIAKLSDTPLVDLEKMPVDKYKKVVANFIKAAYSPVEADPN